MVIRRRKKGIKFRGYTTHGHGSRKKWRGAGSRGGRGMAGTGKRAGHKKAALGNVLGKHGFVARRGHRAQRGINVGHFTPAVLERLVKDGQATKEGPVYVMDIEKLGYDKLLGGGKVSVKLKIHAHAWSASAEEKVKAAGGELSSIH